jgi:crotonobetaine/carnitine-CoA ligase
MHDHRRPLGFRSRIMNDRTLYAVLASEAARAPSDSALYIEGRDWTRFEILKDVDAAAAGLLSLGLRAGDRVVIMADNRYEHLIAWLGSNAASLIDVPINTEAQGTLLTYLVQDSDPRVLIGQRSYLERMLPLLPEAPEVVVVIGSQQDADALTTGARVLTFDRLLELDPQGTFVPPRNHDPATMIYTSGTTGPSKGVVIPQAYYEAWSGRAIRVMGLGAGQTNYTAGPLFHADARANFVGPLMVGGRLALGKRFSVSGFWKDIRESRAVSFAYLGTMLSLLQSAPPRADDRDVPALIGCGGGAPTDIHQAFEARFGVHLFEMYGMTEALGITMNTLNDSRIGSIGKPIPELDVRIVDHNDEPVGADEEGELVFRPNTVNEMMLGYWRKPEATVEAWRNLWFHTGDRVRADEDGFLYYVGRLKDSIRRRGENVSAWEVEGILTRHESVLEAAAIGVPSPLGEEDVAALVTVPVGKAVDPLELHAFCKQNLPRYAVPRYIEVVESLPKTPTERVDKGKVRDRGLTEAAWDAEAS